MLGLYIHVPFCANKCNYCGFFSTHYETIKADEYLSALHLEIKRHALHFAEQTFGSVYIGGGTPTTLTRDQFYRLFSIIHQNVNLPTDAEITVEANPHTITSNLLIQLKKLGVTRISLGVQSFSDEVLAQLGRIHSSDEAVTAVHAVRDGGFRNIGIDLIFGIPGQTEQQWNSTLETTASLAPDHISAYSLSIDEGSQLYRDVKDGKRVSPDNDVSATMYGTALQFLRSCGYHRYEISNFCLPGFECIHNVNYWDRGEYVGIGPGAWSFIGNKRWANVADVGQYVSRLMSGNSVQDQDTVEFVNEEQAAIEKLFLGLRKTSGVDLAAFGLQFGKDALDALMNNIGNLERDGVVNVKKGVLMLTARGILHSNEVLSRMIT